MLRTRIMALAILVAPPLAHSQDSGGSANPLGAFFKGITRTFVTTTSPHASEMELLIEQRDLKGADDLFGKEQAYFTEHIDSHLEILARLVSALNGKMGPGLEAANANVATLVTSEIHEHNWLGTKAAIAEARRALSDYQEYNILRVARFRLPVATELSVNLGRLQERLKADAAQAFHSYNFLGKAAFFDVYPVELSARSFTIQNSPTIVAKAANATHSEILDLFKKYPDLSTQAQAALSRIHRERLVALASQAKDFYAAYTLRKQLIHEGHPADAVLGLQISMLEGHDKDSPYAVSFRNDAQLRTTTLSADALASSPDRPDYLVVFKANAAEPVRKVTERKDVSSRYQSGYRTVPNPAYEQARLQYLKAEQQRARQELNNSLNPSPTAGVALLRGILAGAASSNATQLFNNFQSTPATVDEPTYTEYDFKTSSVLSRKTAELQITVIDYRNHSFRRLVVPWEDKKTFNVAFGIHEKDPNRYSHERSYVPEAAIDSYEKGRHDIAVSSLLNSFVKDQEHFAAYNSFAELFQPTRQESMATASLQPRPTYAEDSAALAAKLDSVVIVQNPSGGLGTGFFVSPDLVLTNHHVVEGARFAEIKLRNGLETVGRIVKVDAGLDLALLKVADKGRPVSFHTTSVIVGTPVEVVGHPRGLTFSMTRGIVSAVRKMKNPLVPGSREMLVIQTDAPINPGNSGGPLYLDGKVVGVNTQKLSARGIEGLGFAVHSEEVMRFLRE